MMYLEDWQRIVDSGDLLNRDLEMISSDGRYTQRGPVKSAHLDGDFLVVTVAWWAYRREFHGELVWTREKFDKTIRISVTWTPPAHWWEPGSLHYASQTYCFRGDQLDLTKIPLEFHIEAAIRDQNIYANGGALDRFKQSATIKINAPHGARRNEDVREWGVVFVVIAHSLLSAHEQVRELCRAGGANPTRLRQAQPLHAF